MCEWAPQPTAVSVAARTVVSGQRSDMLFDDRAVVPVYLHRCVLDIRGELVDARIDKALQEVCLWCRERSRVLRGLEQLSQPIARGRVDGTVRAQNRKRQDRPRE